jgi:hypothetical protein
VSEEGSLIVVTGGTIELVSLSENLGTELAELLDRAERVLDTVAMKAVPDELGVGVGDPDASLVRELPFPAAVIVGNKEVLGAIVSDLEAAEAVAVIPSPVTCISGFDEVALEPAEMPPFGFAREGVADELVNDLELLMVDSEETRGVCEAPKELDELIVVGVESRAEVDEGDDNIERLELDKKDGEPVDSVEVGAFVNDSVLEPTGIIVRTSGIEDELEASEV